ncbi:MAG: hypothetical protein IJ511_02540 [Bacteroides sp.]|nr:hypothetical protein [Bacteroides sp.]
MNTKLFNLLTVSILTAFFCLSCDNSENVEKMDVVSCQDLYGQYQTVLVESESFGDLNEKKSFIASQIKDYDWNCVATTRSLLNLSEEEQQEELKTLLSPYTVKWIEKIENSFVSDSRIMVEQISLDNVLTDDEKRILVTLLAGGDYLKSKIVKLNTRGAADCYAKYQSDCNRALQVYAISGSVGAISAGPVGLAAATAICALQLQWAEDDYNNCLKG